jgi:acetyl esterase/lipase
MPPSLAIFVNCQRNHPVVMKLYRLLLVSLVAMACQKNTGGDNPTDPSAAKTMLNVAYGTDAAQKMDIYLPGGRTTASTKVIVMIHGGAWVSGDKNDFNEYVDSLKRRVPDYAIFNINYRLATGLTNTFPAQENDVKAAIEFIYNKRSEYLISEKFVLLGASAGGHLALLQGYKHTTPVKPKAIVDFFGPTDMVDIYNNPASPAIPQSAVASIVGATPTTNLTLYQSSSPINYVTAQSAPTIILQGGVDPLVAASQSATLNTKLQTMGVVHQYVFYPTEGHSWVGPNLVHSFNQVQAFLAANVN